MRDVCQCCDTGMCVGSHSCSWEMCVVLGCVNDACRVCVCIFQLPVLVLYMCFVSVWRV